MRENIKEALIALLGKSDVIVVKAAATCVAAIAMIEFPLNQWPELITLLQTISYSETLYLRKASL